MPAELLFKSCFAGALVKSIQEEYVVELVSFLTSSAKRTAVKKKFSLRGFRI